jgi:hypothetical protein
MIFNRRKNKDRRSGKDRRQKKDTNFTGPEKRSGKEKRTGKDRRKYMIVGKNNLIQLPNDRNEALNSIIQLLENQSDK